MIFFGSRPTIMIPTVAKIGAVVHRCPGNRGARLAMVTTKFPSLAKSRGIVCMTTSQRIASRRVLRTTVELLD